MKKRKKKKKKEEKNERRKQELNEEGMAQTGKAEVSWTGMELGEEKNVPTTLIAAAPFLC
jgi:hypothetical protein